MNVMKRLKLEDDGQEEELDTIALEDEEELDEDNVICKSPVSTNKCVMH